MEDWIKNHLMRLSPELRLDKDGKTLKTLVPLKNLEHSLKEAYQKGREEMAEELIKIFESSQCSCIGEGSTGYRDCEYHSRIRNIIQIN